jgi:hypothetical protein
MDDKNNKSMELKDEYMVCFFAGGETLHPFINSTRQ